MFPQLQEKAEIIQSPVEAVFARSQMVVLVVLFAVEQAVGACGYCRAASEFREVMRLLSYSEMAGLVSHWAILMRNRLFYLKVFLKVLSISKV